MDYIWLGLHIKYKYINQIESDCLGARRFVGDGGDIQTNWHIGHSPNVANCCFSGCFFFIFFIKNKYIYSFAAALGAMAFVNQFKFICGLVEFVSHDNILWFAWLTFCLFYEIVFYSALKSEICKAKWADERKTNVRTLYSAYFTMWGESSNTKQKPTKSNKLDTYTLCGCTKIFWLSQYSHSFIDLFLLILVKGPLRQLVWDLLYANIKTLNHKKVYSNPLQ